MSKNKTLTDLIEESFGAYVGELNAKRYAGRVANDLERKHVKTKASWGKRVQLEKKRWSFAVIAMNKQVNEMKAQLEEAAKDKDAKANAMIIHKLNSKIREAVLILNGDSEEYE